MHTTKHVENLDKKKKKEKEIFFAAQYLTEQHDEVKTVYVRGTMSRG